MAKTYTKKALTLHHYNDPYLAAVQRKLPEGAGQTFEAGWPLKLASGLLLEWVSLADAKIAAFAMEGASGVTSQKINVVLCEPSKLLLEANLLDTSTAGDEALAAADLGAVKTLEKGTDLLAAGEDGWFFGDTTTGGVILIVDFANRQWPSNNSESFAEVGDTNARIRGRVIDGAALTTSAAGT
jgi:hypothetical protein